MVSVPFEVASIGASRQIFILQDFEIHKIISELTAIGATSVHLLNEDFRLALLQEGRSYPYTPEAIDRGTTSINGSSIKIGASLNTG